MFVQESFLEDENMQDTLDELDETLSLCDLPLYGDQSVEDWEEDLSAESQGSASISSSEHDYFEFFSQELDSFPPENIIFCGKIIPHIKPDASDKAPSKEVECQQTKSIKKPCGWSMFRWSLDSNHHHQQRREKQQQTPKKKKGHDLPMHKMSILISSSSEKARWYLFLTGISRFSSGIELRDIKSRQSRRHIHSPPSSPIQNNNEKVTTNTGSSKLWEVIRVLSCGGNHHPNAMVARSICNRLE